MVFPLASGRVGEPYRQSIEDVLNEDYDRKFSGTQGSIEWVLLENLPPGLKLKSDGTITGIPQSHQSQPYRFRVKVTDQSMRGAEPLELSFTIQMMAPRIRLVSNTTPTPAQTFSAPEQPSLPAASVSVASREGAVRGDSTVAPAQSAADAEMNRAARFASPAPAQVENGTQPTNASINAAQANPTPLPTPQEIAITPASDDISKYISIREDTGDKSAKNLHKGVLYKEVSFYNTRLFADRKSTIIIQLTGVPANGDNFFVSALAGGNPVDIDGLSAGTLQSGDQINAILTANSPATINLRKANAKKGDELSITIRRIKVINNTPTVEVDKTFTIELDDYGFDQGASPSIFLLNRPGVSDSDIQPSLQTTPTIPTMLTIDTTTTTDVTNPVNYSPSPGINYTFSFKPKPNQTGLGYKFLSLLKPGFGVNATLMNFNDQTLNLLDDSQKFLTNQGSDVQLGVGGALSFLGNNVQVTYGANLNAERRRGYFAFGINFAKLLSLVRP